MFPKGWSKIKEDRLCTVYRNISTNRIIVKGKRTPSNCPYTKEEIRAYCKEGAFRMVKMVMDRTKKSLSEVWKGIKEYKDCYR